MMSTELGCWLASTGHGAISVDLGGMKEEIHEGKEASVT